MKRADRHLLECWCKKNDDEPNTLSCYGKMRMKDEILTHEKPKPPIKFKILEKEIIRLREKVAQYKKMCHV